MKLTYGGIDLRPYIEILEGFTPHDGADWSPTLVDNPMYTGANYVKNKIGAKKLEFPFIMQKDLNEIGSLREKYTALQRLLNTKEPKALTMGAMPNVVYYAIPSGTLEFDETVMEGKGTLTFIVPDGVGHALEEKEIVFTQSGSTLVAELENNGTDWADVNYTIKMNHENGYVGLTSQYGVIQLGNIEEADGKTVGTAKVLTQNLKGNFDNWSNGTVNFENTNGKKVVAGANITGDSQYGGRFGLLTRDSFTNTNNSEFFGGLKELKSTMGYYKDWYVYGKAWFETGLMGQTGGIQVNLVAEDDTCIASMIIEKKDIVGNTAQICFCTQDQNGLSVVVRIINFQATRYQNDNPYGDDSRNSNRNMFDIRKIGDTIRFYWNGQYFDHKVSSKVAAKKMSRVQVYSGQYRGRGVNDTQMVTRMYFQELFVQYLDVPTWKDVPNKYPNNSTIFVNGEEGKPYFNGLLRASDEVVGSEYFKIPPGEKTKVIFNCSTFSLPKPTVTAVVKEVFS